MEQIRQYVLSVISAAVLCGLILTFVGKKGTFGAVVKLLCGLFLAITVMGAFLKLDIIDISVYADGLSGQADNAVSEGQQIAYEETCAIIKSQTEAYILDKAASLRAQISAHVTLTADDPPVPCAVTISGSVSPYTKRVLQQYIANDLGITEEHQSWT